ncbi:MAG: lysophospholipid acyltransferase family protein [Planctomycetota bacterium]
MSLPRPQRQGLQQLVHLLIAQILLRAPVRFLYRIRIHRDPRLDHLVCVYAANHRSFADPPLVAMWTRYANGFMARRSLWKLPVIGQVLMLVGGVPVDRGAPTLRSISDAVAVVRGGRSLVIFPEGTRTRDGRLRTLREGPAMIARRAGVPMVPVYLDRSERVWCPGRALPSLGSPPVRLRYGPPLLAPASVPPRERDAWVTARAAAWMQAQERASLGPRR